MPHDPEWGQELVDETLTRIIAADRKRALHETSKREIDQMGKVLRKLFHPRLLGAWLSWQMAEHVVLVQQTVRQRLDLPDREAADLEKTPTDPQAKPP